MYNIVLLPQAEKFYRKLFHSNRDLLKRIDQALESLKKNPLIGKPLKDKLKGRYSLRVGVYRMIYSVERKKVTIYVLDIGHHREVYR